MGLNYTLNRCLSVADGAYIARQDGDDVSMPTRFEKEAAILDASPDIAIVSTAMTYFDENGAWGQSHPVLFPETEILSRERPSATRRAWSGGRHIRQ